MKKPLPSLASVFQETVFCILLFLLPFSNAAIEICFGLLLLGWFWCGLASDWQNARAWAGEGCRQLCLALGVFLGVCAVSVAVSSHRAISWSGFINKWLEYLCLMLFAVELGQRPLFWRRALTVVVAATPLVIIESVTQEIWGYGLFMRHPLIKYARMTGPYTNPSDLATYFMVVMFIIAVWIAVSEGFWKRLGAGAVLLGALACFIRTETRGAWFGFSIGCAALAGISRHRRLRRATAAILVLLVVGAGLWLYCSGQLYDFVFSSDIGKTDRFYMWQAAMRMIQDRPWLGHGLNTFMANYVAYWVGGQQVPHYAHNCYLQMTAETGIAGLAAFLWLLGAILSKPAAVLRRLVSNEVIALAGLFAGLVSFLAQSAVDTNFYVLRQAALFWSLAGLTFGFAEQLAEKS